MISCNMNDKKKHKSNASTTLNSSFDANETNNKDTEKSTIDDNNVKFNINSLNNKDSLIKIISLSFHKKIKKEFLIKIIKNYCERLENSDKIKNNYDKKIFNSKLSELILSSFSFERNIKKTITIFSYIERLMSIGGVNPYFIIYGLCLSERLKSNLNTLKISPDRNNYLLIIFVSIVISLKINEDNLYPYNIYARIGCIDTNKLFLIDCLCP